MLSPLTRVPLQDLPPPGTDAEEAFKGAPPHPLHLVKFEPLPAPAVALARAVLCAAAAGPRQGLVGKGSPSKKFAPAEPPKADEAPAEAENGDARASAAANGAAAALPAEPSSGTAGTPAKPSTSLVALLCAEPINGRTRMWAAYATRAAAEAAMRVVNSLPQLSELLDAPPAQRDTIMPSKQVPPPPLTNEDKVELLARCDGLLAAIEARLGLPGHSAALFSSASASAPSSPLNVDEQLELKLLYLRRLHYFDGLGGGAFPTHTSLLTACGEAHLPSNCVVYAAQQRDGLLAAPVSYAASLAAADAQLAYLSALDAIDDDFGKKAADELEAFYQANCVEEEPGKFRCPLSGKLFKDPVFVRKHIDNKHGHKLLEARRASIEGKYERYYQAGAARQAAMPPAAPPPPRFPRPDDGGKGFGKGGGGKGFGFDGGGKGFGKGGGGKGFGFDGGGKGFGKGFGKGGKGFGKGSFHDGPPEGRGSGGGGPPPPPPDGAEVVERPMVTYRDLDAPEGEDELFS